MVNSYDRRIALLLFLCKNSRLKGNNSQTKLYNNYFQFLHNIALYNNRISKPIRHEYSGGSTILVWGW